MTSERITSPTGERPRLLLLEDDAGVRRSLQLLFRARGFDVRAYAAGAALLADPAACDACCFIADYRLDETDGIEVFCHLRERRSEEHTSELQSLMRISYAVFCLKKKTINNRFSPRWPSNCSLVMPPPSHTDKNTNTYIHP